jgi:arginine kinase
MSESFLQKVLTPELKQKLESITTSTGHSLHDVIKSGLAHPDSNVGIYAPDAESYETFWELFGPIIELYHGSKRHTTIVDDFNPVISTRARVGRNLKGFAFPAGIEKAQRKEVEEKIINALSKLPEDLQGEYFSLEKMDEETRKKLIADHFLFKSEDRFLEASGALRDWPTNRGIFISNDKQLLVWVNEEDHMRIISLEQGGNIKSVYERLQRTLNFLEQHLQFSYSDKFGYLTSCPTNLGTSLRASLHIKLAYFKEEHLKLQAKELKLSVRGVHGEHSDSIANIYDISNTQRLGVTEDEIITTLFKGINRLIVKNLQQM